MPPKGHFSGSPADWLRYSRSDLELARTIRTAEVMFEVLCFHAQQAAEKALKAVLIAKDVPPPKTHNIRTLLDLLPEEIIVPEEIEDAASLSDYAVTSRYPGDFEPVNEEEYKEAVRLAATVVLWAERITQ
ncbi:MAG: HEPN domain-containing protein [Sedimentisphaerales bacterium]|nr:HEPN domain-containing protein [Sedimentisphaerales bacterium]